MDIVKRLLPHVCIILSGMMVILFVIDKFFNSAMSLINNPITKWLLFIFGVVAIIISVMLIGRQRREG